MSDSRRDRELGMQHPITRRDFLNGFSLAVGGSLALPGSIWTNEAIDQAWRAVQEVTAKKS